jgi:hypothetical protein
MVCNDPEGERSSHYSIADEGIYDTRTLLSH